MLVQMRESSPDGVQQSDEVRRLLNYAARIREFSTTIAESGRRLDPEEVVPLDTAVEKLGSEDLSKLYQASRQTVQAQLRKFDAEIAAENGSARGQRLALEKKRLASYVQFDFDEVRRQILMHLNDQ